jgi:hypothetical protein
MSARKWSCLFFVVFALLAVAGCSDGGGADEDGDTLADCADPDCAHVHECGLMAWLAGGDICAYATPLTLPVGERAFVAVEGVLSSIDTDDRTPPCLEFPGTPSPDVVYAFTLTGPAHVVGELRPASWSTPFGGVLSLVRGCDEPDLLCAENNYVTAITRVDGVFGAGTYHLWVDSTMGSASTYALVVELADPSRRRVAPGKQLASRRDASRRARSPRVHFVLRVSISTSRMSLGRPSARLFLSRASRPMSGNRTPE